MSDNDFFSRTVLNMHDCASPEQEDAALGAYLLLYLRQQFDETRGAWQAADDRERLRRTCHAVEVLHRLNFDAESRQMVREGGDWLINMPLRDRLTADERTALHLYPSRFKTLAYIGRFDDERVRDDFTKLLGKSIKGVIRNVGESAVLTTCIALDTLLTLERIGQRRAVCSDERFNAIITALLQQFKTWRPSPTGTSAHSSETPKSSVSRTAARGEIDNPRDLSYVLGLLLQDKHASLSSSPMRMQITRIVNELLATMAQSQRARHSDIVPSLYAALQLAEHFPGDEQVQTAISGLLGDVRDLYERPDAVKRWDILTHTLVLRLLLTLHDASRDDSLAHSIATHLLLEAEKRRAAVQNTLETDLTAVIRERMLVHLGNIEELSGGFTEDRIFRVPFSYWFPTPGFDGERQMPSGVLPNTSVIIKRSTSDTFHTATNNYNLLAPHLRSYFVRHPAESQVHKSGLSPAYYLPMEDLADMRTFYDVFNELDQRAMSTSNLRLLQTTTEHICQVSFALFGESSESHSTFPGSQISRLYLSRIEKSLMRGLIRVPWLKNLLKGFHRANQHYKGLDNYLTIINRQMNKLQPHALGLAHGDFHARNIMVSARGDEVKLIDLDKLEWTGDYLADLGNLLTDICIYRRVSEPENDYGLPRSDLVLTEPGHAENTLRYPALGRPATVNFQTYVLERIDDFAAIPIYTTWRPRLWLSAATALMTRLAFHVEREVAAVLYGEAVRLLDGLARFLDAGQQPQQLPALLVPTPEMEATHTPSDLPEWIAQNSALRELHDGLRDVGLRAEPGRDSINYYPRRNGQIPLARLSPARSEARRDGIARLFLQANMDTSLPPTHLNVIPPTKQGDALGTIVILSEESDLSEVVALVQACLEALGYGR